MAAKGPLFLAPFFTGVSALHHKTLLPTLPLSVLPEQFEARREIVEKFPVTPKRLRSETVMDGSNLTNHLGSETYLH